MNKLDNYQYLSDASIRIDDVTFRPWPDFCIIGEVGCGKNHLLPNLLVSSDPLAMMWRGKIPTEVLELIRRFPVCLWSGLLELSQLHAEYFLQWGQNCPALIGLLAMHSSEIQADRDLDRIRALYKGRKDRMKVLGLPPTREAFRILQKLSVEDCYPTQLEQLRSAVNHSKKRRLMTHLSRITCSTLETLLLPDTFLDVNLLQLEDAGELPDDYNSVAALCSDIADCRRKLGKLPVWPYRGSKISVHKLLQARDSYELELLLGEEYKATVLPDPPVGGIVSSQIRIEALRTVRDICDEGTCMKNCLITYAQAIMKGTHYAYKMIYPERATILLNRKMEDWYPVEIRGYENSYIDPNHVDLIYTWLGNLNRKEVPDDFPF